MKYENVEMQGDAENVRYSLVKKGERPLIVIGVNPSKATAECPDPTMNKVLGFAERNGFDGFIMLNVYPQRSTRPDNLHRECDAELHKKNLETIKTLIAPLDKPVILLAFGNAIGIRRYMADCLRDIVDVLKPYNPQWKQIGNPTKWGNPRHPSRARYSLFCDFDMKRYLKLRC